MRARALIVIGSALVAAPVACTLTNDLDGYAGGARDAAVDSAAPDTRVPDTSPVDTSAPDTSTDTTVDTRADTLEDTSVTDSGSDTAADTAVDSAKDTASDATDATDVMDAPPCGVAYAAFGLSEIMVRGTFGTNDKREWVELTNYGSAPLDVSGVTVRLVSGTEKGAFVFPAGTTVAAGGAVVVAGDKTTFLADVMSGTVDAASVYSFGKDDVLVNSSANEVRLFAPSCATPYETAIVPMRTWGIGEPYAYPVPDATCTLATRLTPTGALGPAWKEPPKTTPYGSYSNDAGTQPLYGTPTKPNTGVACP